MRHGLFMLSANNNSFRVTILDLCAHSSRLGSVVVGFAEMARQGQSIWPFAEASLLFYIVLLGIFKGLISNIGWRVHLLQHINLLQIGALLLVLLENLEPLILLRSSINLSTSTLCKLGFIASSVATTWVTPRVWYPDAASQELYHRILGDEPSLEEICSYFSYFISYSWLTGLVFRGFRRQLNLNDLPQLPWFDEPLIWLDRILTARSRRSHTLWTILGQLSSR